MDFELYHDESKKEGYWHGILLIPSFSRRCILSLLNEARSTTGYPYSVSFKKIKRFNRIYDCAKAWISIAIAAMNSKPNSAPIQIYLGRHPPNQCKYDLIKDCMYVKFILFRERDTLERMTGYPDHASKVETTLRMAIKGGIHFLGYEESSIHIQRIHLDGHEHYQRRVDKSRLIDRINGLREYCSFAERDDLIDDNGSDHQKSGSQQYDDCQFLQLTDLMIGAFRVALRGTNKMPHKMLASQAESLLGRYAEGPARMANSRWRDSICLSQCYLEDGHWHFGQLESTPSDESRQLKLPF